MSETKQTSMSESQDAIVPGRGLHRWSIVMVCLVWPLIWVGGQVTTYDAGMAVPDWPGTYGYNLFLYPYQTWLFGPFDLFIEHGHRLLGAVVGLVAIIAVVYAFLSEPRAWVRGLSVAVLIAVIGQGLLGGARVVLADRTLAMVHGCTAEIFFTLCVAMMVVTSRWWWVQASRATVSTDTMPELPAERLAMIPSFQPHRGLIALAAIIMILAYLQVVLGAQLRHVQPTASPGGFKHLVYTHIATAFVVLLLSSITAWKVRDAARGRRGQTADNEASRQVHHLQGNQNGCGDLTLSRPALLLVLLVGLQITLGLATWVARYGVPQFAQVNPSIAAYLVKGQAFAESLIITGHVATGALVLVTSAFLLLRLARANHCRRPTLVAG
jgi:cytochrome c oxidase assembly protein subunit 15